MKEGEGVNCGRGFSAAVLAVALSQALTAAAITRAPETAHYSAAQLKQMIRQAHTQNDYLALARYFEQRHREYVDQAADEMAEWARRSQITDGPAAKYPRPVDAARNLYDYYAHQADDAAFQADKFHRFAEGVAALDGH